MNKHQPQKHAHIYTRALAKKSAVENVIVSHIDGGREKKSVGKNLNCK